MQNLLNMINKKNLINCKKHNKIKFHIKHILCLNKLCSFKILSLKNYIPLKNI